MGYFDSTAGGALSGAGTGAAIGSLVPGVGTGVGAAVGGGIGALTGFFRGRSQSKQKRAIGQARLRLEDLARSQRSQREADLARAMSFFDPVESEIRRLYG